MKITVRYFASLREALGDAEVVEVVDNATLSALRDQLIAQSARHASALHRGRTVRCALNLTMSDENTALVAGAEVAFFPPVTGG